MQKQRRRQVESTLQRGISQVLARRMSDPRIGGIVSVTAVKVSADGRDAAVFVSVLPESRQTRTLCALRHATGYIQSLLAKAMESRSLPRLDFCLDVTLKKQAALFSQIAEQRPVTDTPAR